MSAEIHSARRSDPSVALTRTLGRLGVYATLISVAILLTLPLVWLLLSSLKNEIEYMAYPIKVFPTVPAWENYIHAVTLVPFWKYAGQSAYLAALFTIPCVFASAMAGFAFSRVPAPGRNSLFVVVIALLIMPQIVTTIPQYVLFTRLRLVNTYWPWLLWGISASPFHIFLFRQFFTAIPAQLEDAAEVDGCGLLRVFLQIFLPNAKPVLATSFIFNLSWIWGDWFHPLIYLDDAKTTLAVAVTRGYTSNEGYILMMPRLAAATLYTIPLIVLFFVGQKYIIQGVVTSGIKG